MPRNLIRQRTVSYHNAVTREAACVTPCAYISVRPAAQCLHPHECIIK